MRDIAFVLVLVPAIGYCITRPWAAACLWALVSLMNPHRLTYGFAFDLPVGNIVFFVLLISLIIKSKELKPPRGPIPMVMILFLLWTCVTTIFAFDVSRSLVQLEKFGKILLVVWLSMWAISKKEHLIALVWVCAISIGFYGVKGGIHFLKTGGAGRVRGPLGSAFADNTDMGLAVLMIVPLLYFLYETASHRWIRRGLLASIALCTIAAIGTKSRGALVALVGLAGYFWWRAPRKILASALIAVLGGGVYLVAAELISERAAAIESFQSDDSAVGRLVAWETMFNAANAHVTGVGYAANLPVVFEMYSPRFELSEGLTQKSLIARAAHSIYFQVLGEHGWPGLVLFLTLFGYAFVAAGRVRRSTLERPDTKWMSDLASMIQVSLVVYAVGGAFLSQAYFDLPYTIVLMVLVLQRLQVEQPAQVGMGAATAQPSRTRAWIAGGTER